MLDLINKPSHPLHDAFHEAAHWAMKSGFSHYDRQRGERTCCELFRSRCRNAVADLPTELRQSAVQHGWPEAPAELWTA